MEHHEEEDHRERRRPDRRRERRHKEASTELCVRIPTEHGLPPPRALVKMFYNRTYSANNFNVPGNVFYSLANGLVGVSALPSFPAHPTDRFGYSVTWGNLYTSYLVHASKIRLMFNSEGAEGYLCVWPTAYLPPGAVFIPATLRSNLQFPQVKYKRFGSEQAGGTDRAMIELEHFVNTKEYMTEEDWAGPGASGYLPYMGTTGFPATAGSNPSSSGNLLGWCFTFWSTNMSNSGAVAGDLTIEIEDYVELFEPRPEDPDALFPALNGDPLFINAPDAPPSSLQRGEPPQTPIVFMYDNRDVENPKILDLSTLSQKAVDPHDCPKPVYPDLTQLEVPYDVPPPDPPVSEEEYITVKVPKTSLKK